MSNERIEELISQELDGELDQAGQEELLRAMADDPLLAEVRDDFVNIGKMMRESSIPVVKSPEATWQEVRREIRKEEKEAAAQDTPMAEGKAVPEGRVILFPWRWVGPIAIAAAVILGFVLLPLMDRSKDPVVAATGSTVEYLSTDLEDAITMTYVEPESGITVIWVVENEENDEG